MAAEERFGAVLKFQKLYLEVDAILENSNVLIFLKYKFWDVAYLKFQLRY